MKLTAFLFACIAGAGMLFLISCKEKTVRGDGNVISHEIPIDIYNEIRVEGAMDVFYECHPDEAGYLRVEVDDDILPLLDVKVKKNKLEVKAKESIHPSRFVIYTNSPSLKHVESKGAANVHLEGLITGDKLKIELKGTGNLEADQLVYDKAEFYLNGAGNMELGGRVEKAKIELSGNGDIHAFDLAIDEAECKIKGNGDIKLEVIDKFSVEIKGKGNITYKGNPQITKQKISGQGTLKAK